jgi:NCAIR mutase (PurE)-related protein
LVFHEKPSQACYNASAIAEKGGELNMNREYFKKLLDSVKEGSVSVEDAIENLKQLPYQDLGCAQVDHHRELRQGMPEVIFGEGKTAEQIVMIISAMSATGSNVLVTRLDNEKSLHIRPVFPAALYHSEARCLTLEQRTVEAGGKGTILIVSAGTSDIPVASEAALTARFLGNRVEQIHDVGVAGIHRLLARHEQLSAAAVIIVVAGMEGALPSVVGGLVDKPVIAVPTSVGYGASFGGIAALLGMLNSCAAGVTVVNIDNGFGAACAASLINRV